MKIHQLSCNVYLLFCGPSIQSILTSQHGFYIPKGLKGFLFSAHVVGEVATPSLLIWLKVCYVIQCKLISTLHLSKYSNLFGQGHMTQKRSLQLNSRGLGWTLRLGFLVVWKPTYFEGYQVVSSFLRMKLT